MARIPNQPLLRGTIGNLIYYSVGGRQYVRSKPTTVRQPNTPKQLLARDKFRQSSKLAKALSGICPELGIDEERNATKSTYHTILAVLRTSPFAEGGNPVRWVWEDLIIRKGEKHGVEISTNYSRETQLLQLNWNAEHFGKGSQLLVLGIHTESLEAELHRFSVEDEEGMIEASINTAWYVCEKKRSTKVLVSGSQFVLLIEEGG